MPDAHRSLDLLAQAQRGDSQALEELVTRYQDRLHRIVRIQLGRSALRRDYDSMDIVQSTFCAALPHIGALEARTAAGLLQWLSVIATNQIRDAYARQHAGKREIERRVDLDAAGSADGLALQLAADETAPDERALKRELRDLLDDEVAGLPDDQRSVVVLRDYIGEGWDRIAAELGRDNGAARQLHQRAWIRLRQALRPKLEGRVDRPCLGTD